MLDGLRTRCWSFLFKRQSISPARFHVVVARRALGCRWLRAQTLFVLHNHELSTFRLFIVEISENGGKLHLLSCRQIWHFLIPPVRILSQPLTGGLSRRCMGFETLGRVITPVFCLAAQRKLAV
jgi:hypothetical protein